MSGYIKLRRSLLDWEWYGDHNATRLLIHLLISVNYEDKKWQGIIVKKGSMVLSWATLSERSGLSVQQCRTAMGKLISSGEVTKKVTNKYQVVTLVKWDKIQLDHLNITDKSTFNQQTNNKQITTTKEREEYIDDIELDFSKNEKHMMTIVNNKEKHQIWIETNYRTFKLKKGKLGAALQSFNATLVSTSKVHPNIRQYKNHFHNWMNKQVENNKLKDLQIR